MKWSYENDIEIRRYEYDDYPKVEVNLISLDRAEKVIASKNKRIQTKDKTFEHQGYKGFDFSFSEVLSPMEFDSLIILSRFRFLRTIFTQSFIIHGATIHSSSHFEETFFIEKIEFHDVTFKDDVSFWQAIFLKKVEFNRCTFEKNACFENTVFVDEVVFNRCVFENPVNFALSDTPKTNQCFYRTIKGGFNDSVFEQKVVFYHRHFAAISFNNTKFKKLVDFYQTTFLEPVCFHKTDFEDTSVFSKATFKELAVFLYTQVSKNMILREADFQDGVNFSFINFIGGGNLNVFNLKIEFKLNKAPKESGAKEIIDDWKSITHLQKRETFRTLKNESIKQNNKIQALEFHQKEMDSFREELKATKHCLNMDRLILAFNRYTNNYGLNWVRGFWVTLGVSIMCFVLYYISLTTKPIVFTSEVDLGNSFQCIGIVLGYFIQFINPTHNVHFMHSYLGNWSVFWDYLSRIAIGLCIYQTIQAFRKFGKV
ncbi:pentapeptide repeat-containing protein [Flammeovirgaceae bacterium SG7u.111]|nr:pentapeptide repeat-containing protein [Flammeovirgaceae bacterium SG7u.132]WPO36662.1 pentapeptide repeat-containing protein [Flammeovirgaceae bacterium SG7u.111]